MDKFPDKNDLPVTEGPPEQDEPIGQKPGGPPPNTISKELEAKLYSRKLELLIPLRDFSPQERTSLKLLATPQVTPDMVVSALQGLLGTGESPPGSNCNALTNRAGVGCVAWCDIGWWTALFNAGFNAGGHINMPGVTTDYWFGDAYVPSTEHHFEAAGRFDSKPVPGAGEIHYWSSKVNNPGDSHMAGYIHDYGDGTHLNIECNHNNLCEYVRRPNNDSTRAGYCIPVYVSSSTPTSVSFHPTGGQEDSTMALVTGPTGSRVDLVVVGLPDPKADPPYPVGSGPVYHVFANSIAELVSAKQWEPLDGYAYSVSAGWTADGSTFVVSALGVDGHVWLKTWDGAHKWSPWQLQVSGNVLVKT